MHADLDRIEARARKALATTWEVRLARACLGLVRECRFWRNFVGNGIRVIERCPRCDYDVEVDVEDAYRRSEQRSPHCLTCGTVLSVRIALMTEATS